MLPTTEISWRFYTVVVVCAVLSASILSVADGNVILALAPILGGLLCVGIWKLPMRYIAHGLLFVALVLDNTTERPGRNLFTTPLNTPGSFLYEALSKTLHIGFLKPTGLELFFIILACIVGLRMLVRDSVDGKTRPQAAAPLLRACFIAMLTLVALEVYGLGTGGSFPHSLLQMRAMFFLPFMTLFFAYSFKSRRDINVLLNTLISVGLIRAFLCIYYFITFVKPHDKNSGESGDGTYVTTHSDSILAAVVIVIFIVTIYQHPTLRSMIAAALVVPPVALGIIFNNRRIAFVAVALGLFFCYFAANEWFKRRVQRTLLTLAPIVLVYIAAGWGAHGGWAKPVQSLKSVIVQRDTSSATRDIENYNLLQTLRRNPLNGSGFGHEYVEAVKAFDISKIFEAYRYVPHNSFLWFWGVGGVLGFTAYWMYLSIGIFMAARVVRFAESNRQAVMGMTAISSVMAYGSQCFGDMGFMSWMGGITVAACLGMCASLATKTGAWHNNGGRRRTGLAIGEPVSGSEPPVDAPLTPAGVSVGQP